MGFSKIPEENGELILNMAILSPEMYKLLCPEFIQF
jgi:hypothetical protein